MPRTLMLISAVLLATVISTPVHGQIRLIGITGDLHSGEGGVSPDDESLFEINLTNAATTKLSNATFIPDSNTIGYNPTDGLIYHLGGSESYRDDPVRFGYNDNHYMESINPTTYAATAIFNANGPPVIDGAPVFGLAAPRPSWVFPAERRTEEQTGEEFQGRGENEYGSARGLAWSEEKGLFYITSGNGFFTMTPQGESIFLGQPGAEGGEMKGIAFVDVAGQEKLYASSKDSAFVYEINPDDGQQIGDPIEILAPLFAGGTPEPVGKILGLATHPVTNTLYGILQGVGIAEVDRTLATIDLSTGQATVIGTMIAGAGESQTAFASIAFVGFTSVDLSADKDSDGDVDGADFLLIQRGFGGAYTSADILDWKSDYGNGTSTTTTASAIPEPATAVLAVLGLFGIALRRRQ